MMKKTLAATSVILAAGLFGSGAMAAGAQSSSQGYGQPQQQQSAAPSVGDQRQSSPLGQDIQQQDQQAQLDPEQLNSDQLKQVQQALGKAGFDAGAVDGTWGPDSASALENFRESQGMEAEATLDQQTLQALDIDPQQFTTQQAQLDPEQLNSDQLKQVQQALGKAGFDVGTVDGTWGQETASALENFRESKGMTADATLDHQTLQALDIDPQQFTTQQAQTPDEQPAQQPERQQEIQ